MTLSTFHAFSLRLCRQHIQLLPEWGLTPEFRLLGAAEQLVMVEDILRDWELKVAREHAAGQYNSAAGSPAALLGRGTADELAARRTKLARQVLKVLQATRAGIERGSYATFVATKLADAGWPTLAHFQDQFDGAMRAANAMDFGSLIVAAAQLVTTQRAVSAALGAKFRYLLVDEFQDSSAPQWKLIVALGSVLRGAVTVVGDDDQSIYGFQGAWLGNFDAFKTQWSDAAQVRLRINYRSTPTIVAAAGALVRTLGPRRIPKPLIAASHAAARASSAMGSQVPPGPPIAITACVNNDAETSEIIALCKQYAARGVQWRHIAVLTRRRVIAGNLTEALQEAGVPVKEAGSRVFSRMDVQNARDIMAACISPDSAWRLVAALAAFQRGAPKTNNKLSIRFSRALRSAAQSLHSVSGVDCTAATLWQLLRAFVDARKREWRAESADPDDRTRIPNMQSVLVQLKELVQDVHEELYVEVLADLEACLLDKDLDTLRHLMNKLDAAQQEVHDAELADAVAAVVRALPKHKAMPFNAAKAAANRGRLGKQHSAIDAYTRAVRAAGGITSLEDALRAAVSEFEEAWYEEQMAGLSNSVSQDTATHEVLRIRGAAELGGHDEHQRAVRLRDFVDFLSESVDSVDYVRAAAATAPKAGKQPRKSAVLQRTMSEGLDAVWIGTMHQAKGLEWPVVLLPRWNDGEVPLLIGRAAARSAEGAQLNEDEQQSLDEETRLAYVALSRAQHSLHVTWVQATSDGSPASASRFLEPLKSKHVPTSSAFRGAGRQSGATSAVVPPTPGGAAGIDLSMACTPRVLSTPALGALSAARAVTPARPPALCTPARAGTIQHAFANAASSAAQRTPVPGQKRDRAPPLASPGIGVAKPGPASTPGGAPGIQAFFGKQQKSAQAAATPESAPRALVPPVTRAAQSPIPATPASRAAPRSQAAAAPCNILHDLCTPDRAHQMHASITRLQVADQQNTASSVPGVTRERFQLG